MQSQDHQSTQKMSEDIDIEENGSNTYQISKMAAIAVKKQLCEHVKEIRSEILSQVKKENDNHNERITEHIQGRHR